MPRCDDTWVRKGDTTVEVKVPDPPKKQTLVLRVAFFPREKGLPVLKSLSFGKQELKAGAEWLVPAAYRSVFTLLTTGSDAVGTELLIAGKKPNCSSGAHCQGQCKPSGDAGVAGSWVVTTFRGAS